MVTGMRTINARLIRFQLGQNTSLIIGLESICVIKNFSISFPYPETLQEIEIKGSGLIDLAEKISRQVNTQYVV